MKKINWRYALGELLIVIIGISIAFGLNNWAQSRKDKKLAITYLENIVGDVNADISQIDSNLIQLENIAAEVDGFIPHLFRVLPGRDTVPSQIFMIIHQYVSFFPHDATYESLKYSGDLKLIQNFPLKNKIVEHYNGYDKLFFALERHGKFSEKYSAEYFMKEVDHARLFYHKQPEILDDPYMKNLLFASKGLFQIQMDAHELAKKECLALKTAIESEVERLN